MSRYINREDLLKNLKQFAPEHLTPLIVMLIEKQPTADVAEVMHGKWIDCVEKISGKIQITCSQCGRFLSVYLPYNFCPNCGARMDGETNDT